MRNHSYINIKKHHPKIAKLIESNEFANILIAKNLLKSKYLTRYPEEVINHNVDYYALNAQVIDVLVDQEVNICIKLSTILKGPIAIDYPQPISFRNSITDIVKKKLPKVYKNLEEFLEDGWVLKKWISKDFYNNFIYEKNKLQRNYPDSSLNLELEYVLGNFTSMEIHF